MKVVGEDPGTRWATSPTHTREEAPMTSPKAKPIGTTVDVREGATVIRPGASEATPITITGGVYVLDVPGVHVVDGKEITAADDAEVAGS